MSRQLRPRKSKPTYHNSATDADLDDEATQKGVDTGPSTSAIVNDSDSSSEFRPENNEVVTTMQQDEEDDALMNEVVDEEGDEPNNDDYEQPAKQAATPNTGQGSTSKGKGKAPVKKRNEHPGLARTKRQMYTLPTPSVHHRHRAVPLYRHHGRVERLERPPGLFDSPRVIVTNGIIQNKVMERVNKAWGYNVGTGPLWEMVEDRGWFKESSLFGNDGETEAERRPRVHTGVRVKNGWRLLSKEEAAPYLPSDNITTEEGNLKPPSPVKCFFGPYGTQTQRQVRMFDALSMADFLPESNAHVFNPGAPAWGIDWCPIHQDNRLLHRFKQYLATGPFPSSSHSPEIGAKVLRLSYAKEAEMVFYNNKMGDIGSLHKC